MTSYLRFFLALLVLLSHVGVGVVNGFNLGVTAVVVFYILAGHVVSHLIFDVFQLFSGNSKCLIFYYLERVLRIYPLYLFFLLLIMLFTLITSFGDPELNPTNLLTNILIIPLNFFMFIKKYLVVLKSLNPPDGWWLIPQAWSLGTELLAYFSLPFLLRYKRLGIIFFLISFITYNLANFEVINTDFWGYRLLPGVLFIFLMGAFLQNYISGKGTNWEKILLLFSYSICIISFIYFVKSGLHPYYAVETLMGIVFGLPIVFLSINFPIKLPFKKFIGNVSYGIFLTHFFGIWFFEYLGVKKDPVIFTLLVFLFSLTLSVIGVLIVERYFEKLRFKLSSLCKESNYG